MNDSHEKKLDELLGRELFGDVVKLPAEPDFADWCRKHPDAVGAIRSQPKNHRQKESQDEASYTLHDQHGRRPFDSCRRSVLDAIRQRREERVGGSD